MAIFCLENPNSEIRLSNFFWFDSTNLPAAFTIARKQVSAEISVIKAPVDKSMLLLNLFRTDNL